MPSIVRSFYCTDSEDDYVQVLLSIERDANFDSNSESKDTIVFNQKLYVKEILLQMQYVVTELKTSSYHDTQHINYQRYNMNL